MTYKIKTGTAQLSDQLQYNKLELLNEVRKIYPLLNGPTPDPDGNPSFDGERIKGIQLSLDKPDALTHGLLIQSAIEIITFLIDGANQERLFNAQRAISTTNIPLTGPMDLVVDGVTFDSNSVGDGEPSAAVLHTFGPYLNQDQKDRGETKIHGLILAGQTNPGENGLYVFEPNTPTPGTYTLRRSHHMKTGTGLGRGATFTVNGEGTANGGTLWMSHECVIDGWPYWPILNPAPVNPYNVQSVKFTRMTLKKSTSTITDLAGAEDEAATGLKMNELLGIYRDIQNLMAG
jgi:hypothetical protein